MTTGSDIVGQQAAHRRRAAALGVVLTLVLLCAAGLTVEALIAHAQALAGQPRLTVDDAGPLVALAVVVAGLAWLAVIVAASSRDLLARRRPCADRTRSSRVPASRAARVTALLLAATAFGSMAATSTASALPATTISAPTSAPQTVAEPRAPVPDFAPSTPCQAPEPGWTGTGPGLQRSATTDQAGLLGRCGGPRSGDEVVVHRGDSLWSIVQRDLGPDAGPSEIARTWPAWYTANRDAIGPDPDALLPGTTLHRPTQEVLR